MQEGIDLEHKLADIREFLVTGPVEKKNYLPHLISPPMLIRIQCPCCLYLLCIEEDYSGSACQFLNSIKCHLGENSLCCATQMCLAVL